MSSAFVSSPWPAPAPTAAAWRFARELPRSQGQGDAAVQWAMPRNPSFVPGRLCKLFVALSLLSLVIGMAFWWLGAPAVLPLAGAELLALGTAFWACTRHARDAEQITLAGRRLDVEHRFGRAVERASFRAEWVRIEPAADDGSLVEISGQGQRMRVGRYLRPELRSALARELRLAVRRESVKPATRDTDLEPQ